VVVREMTGMRTDSMSKKVTKGVTYQANGNLCERRFEALVHRLVDEVLVHLFNAGARLREATTCGHGKEGRACACK